MLFSSLVLTTVLLRKGSLVNLRFVMFLLFCRIWNALAVFLIREINMERVKMVVISLYLIKAYKLLHL